MRKQTKRTRGWFHKTKSTGRGPKNVRGRNVIQGRQAHETAAGLEGRDCCEEGNHVCTAPYLLQERRISQFFLLTFRARTLARTLAR